MGITDTKLKQNSNTYVTNESKVYFSVEVVIILVVIVRV